MVPHKTFVSFPSSKSRTSLRTCIASAFLVTILFPTFLSFNSSFVKQVSCPESTASSSPISLQGGWANTNISSASQGKLWHPTIFRTFLRPRRTAIQPNDRLPPPPPSDCSVWGVVTTIFEPTELLFQLRALKDSCLVVVGDRKTNNTAWRQFESHALASRTVYLSVEDQENLPFRSVKHIPWNHFGRKNIGYLYAISRGAKYIWDTDDDNALRSKSHFFDVANLAMSDGQVPLAGIAVSANTTTHLWNPYPFFKPLSPRSASPVPDAWPRGLPLQFVRNIASADPATSGSISVKQVGVFQAVANNDPDVDAIFRLTRELPFVFQKENAAIALPHGRVSPFNAQATLWTREAFWGLLLPVTVHGRVSDIWRSYFVQRLMADVGLHIAFTSPVVKQIRNIHSLIADLQSEVPLYTQVDELVRWLQRWKPYNVEDSLFLRMEQLMVDLYEIGVIEEQDVLLTQAWLDDIEVMRYAAEDEDQIVAARLKTRDTVTLPEAVEPVVDSQPNVAVCVSGPLRAMNLKSEEGDDPLEWIGMTSPLSPPDMTVVESIQRVLYPQLGKPDIFAVLSAGEKEHALNAGEHVCEPLRPRNGGLLSCQVVEEREVTTEKLKNFYSVDRELSEDMLQGLLQQHKGMLQCHAAIQNRTKVTGKKYDWVVFLQPDTYMIEFPSLERLGLDAKDPTIWYGSIKNCCCDHENRFGISRPEWMQEYFERLLYLLTWDWNWFTDTKPEMNGKSSLKQLMSAVGVQLLPHEGIHLCPVCSHTKSGSDDEDSEAPSDQVRTVRVRQMARD